MSDTPEEKTIEEVNREAFLGDTPEEPAEPEAPEAPEEPDNEE